MPSKKKGNATKRKPRQKTIKEHIPDEKFVTKFLAVMQRFPENTLGEMSLDDEFVVDTFFYRLVQFTKGGGIEFKPRFLLMAFMIVNFPDLFLSCKCNPFRRSLIYRSLGFVGATFQVTMECSPSEDDAQEDFLPVDIVDTFVARLNKYLEVLRFHRRFLIETPCKCPGSMLHF